MNEGRNPYKMWGYRLWGVSPIAPDEPIGDRKTEIGSMICQIGLMFAIESCNAS